MLARTRISLATTTLLLLGSTSAFAVDADAFAQRLKAVAQKQNMSLSFDSIEAEGENVVLKGVSGGEADENGKVAEITFENVSGSTADGWDVERIAFPDFDETEDGVRTRIGGVVIEGMELVGTTATDVPAAMKFSDFYFQGASIGSLEVEKDGKTVFSLADASLNNEIGDDGTFTADFDFGDFTADLTTGEDAEATKAVQEIGYGKLSGTIAGSATWNPTSGLLELDPFDIEVKNAGDLSVTYGISGYTPAFIESLQQLQQQMAASPDNQQASGMAVMGLISQLYLNSAEITFVDDSLTGKLLDYYAGKNGQTREQLIQGLTGMLPMFLSYLQNPEFQKAVTDAVTAYLTDPKSLSISIDPANPVPVTQLIGAAMGAPQTLPSVLSLTVSAND
ncbi:MAG TPA: hypothetical protein VIN77_06615 [Aurantimonas sp.]|uniref:DUF945 domain-containing protein n=1 Tax=Aurantimonas marianensis TaxID=2920428 RepID=A0A9X2H8Q9_9HYPH|nr:hypothetical protein [Aurantimonas marianensis]MCP3056356.1 hypothetical protein [Aurantimonas marianensis]